MTTNRLYYEEDNLDVLRLPVDDESVDLGQVVARGREEARAETVRAHV